MRKTSKLQRGQARTYREQIGIFVGAGLPALVVWMFLVSGGHHGTGGKTHGSSALWWCSADLGSNSLLGQVRKPEGVCPPFAQFGRFALSKVSIRFIENTGSLDSRAPLNCPNGDGRQIQI